MRQIGAGELRNGVYQMKFDKKAVANHGTSNGDAILWHMRMGHPSYHRLKLVSGLCLPSNLDYICDACHQAKQSRLPFPISMNKSTRPFALIHVDIWERYTTPSLNDAHYFLTIVDDFFRGTWVYLMKHKSEAYTYLTTFCSMVNTQFEYSVQVVKSDNGTEFTSNAMKDYFYKHGILLQTSCTGTPQQNGRVERKHKHILEVARALRFQASLPLKFWGECVLTATYLINITPTPKLSGKCPYEILFKKLPSYSHLRVFGSLCYALNSNKSKDKFESKAVRCVFLGYPHSQKSYKVFDLEKHKLFVSRDVIFYEREFPCSASQPVPRHVSHEQSLFIDDDLPTQAEIQTQNDMVISSTSNRAEPSVLEEEHVETNNNSPSNHDHQNDALNTTLTQTTRPTRVRQVSTKLQGFDYNIPPSLTPKPATASAVSPCIAYPLSSHLSYNCFSASHKAFLAAITCIDEPTSYAEAIKNDHWRQAMKQEIAALEENQTWTLEELPPRKHAIDSKWVYKIKYKSDGTVERYKARLVAKGYSQIEGMDYHDTFAPVAKLTTVKSLLAVAVARNWELHQLDVHNAFLHGNRDEEIYMRIPQGFHKPGDTRVCRLRKSLYGLK